MDRVSQAREFVERYRDLRVGQKSTRWEARTAELDQLIAQGDDEQLAVVADTLESEPDDPFLLAKMQARNGLALIRSPRAIDAFLDRARRPPDGWRGTETQYAWECAALLGHAQTLEGLDRALRDHGEDASRTELLASWIQECVVRGGRVAELERAREMWRRLTEAGHPLSWLPLELAPIEQGLFLESYRLDWVGNWFPIARSPMPLLAEVSPAASVSAEKRPLDDETRRAIASIFGDEGLFPNACYEIEAFEASACSGPGGLLSCVASLPLVCLTDARVIEGLEISAGDAFFALFAHGTRGGAYGKGLSAAWGRRRAWRSAGALACRRSTDDFVEVVAAVEAARWGVFKADAPWWYQICIDVGLACLSGTRQLRVLAATDSD